jgi:predicted ABC-type ATPase
LSEALAQEPRLLIIAGPNGSGKTTLTNRLRALGLDFGEYINADDIALQMPAGPDRDRQAQIEADRRRAAAFAQRRSFSFETVMSHPSKIDEMRAAKAAGYLFTFIGVALQDPQLNVRRVALRVREGGHDVPTDRIVARYGRTLALMPEAIALADRALVFDNSDSELGPVLALTAHRQSNPKLGILSVRVAPFADAFAEHWVNRFLVTGLRRLRDENGLKVHFGAPLIDESL